MGFLSKIFPISVPLPRPSVQEGKTRICIAGFGFSHHTGRARAIATAIVEGYPDEYETWFYFDSRGYRPEFLDAIKKEIKESGASIPEDHKSSPFCWLEIGGSKKEMIAIGGRDKLCEWTQAKFDASDDKNAKILPLCEEEPPHSRKEIFFDNMPTGTIQTSTSD
mmetsp:Transcript_8172/g.20248  ORF Transcript_8172/g.20248 Transcript_8172/m.20248 type:complete len:165 (-) Transcript_8172:264-758(-)